MFSVFSNELYKIFHSKKIYVFSAIIVALAGIMFLGDMPIKASDLLVKEFLITLLPIFFAIIIAESFTEEYKAGTLKLTLLHPISRTHYLLGKILALIPIGLFLVGLSGILGFLVDFIKLGSSGININNVADLFAKGVLSLFPILAFSMIILLLSLILNSSGAVIGGTFGFMILFQLLAVFAGKYNMENLIITNYFNMFFDGSNGITGLGVVAAYLLGFLVLSLVFFNRKDIAE